MKKNLMTRIASGLMVAVLLTTCVISGTFAKYVTEGSASDTARVAKWGVVVTASGNLYSKDYKAKTDNGPTTHSTTETLSAVTVCNPAQDQNLVAPGTNSGDGYTFTLKGTPEVAVHVAVAMTKANGDALTTTDEIFLAQKTDLPDMTTADGTDKFDNTALYNPVVYTLTNGAGTELVKGTLLQVATYLNDLSGDYKANTNLATIKSGTSEKVNDGTYKLTWEWKFENILAEGDDDAKAAAKKLQDQRDTLLGDLAAGTTLTPSTTLTAGTDYNLAQDVKIAITVTQID